MRQSLFVVVGKESLEHMAVGGDAVRPIIPPNESACALQLLLDEWHGDLCRRSVGKARDGAHLGLLEGLEYGRRQPGMGLNQSSAHTDQMHDRENPCAPVVI